MPVVDHFEKQGRVRKISAEQTPDEVYAEVQQAFEGAGFKKQESFAMPDKKVYFVLGGPGSGKGTQCAKIVDDYGFVHLSAGDLLRAEVKSGSEDGIMIDGMIKNGEIVPMHVTLKLLHAAMKKNDEASGFLIDGFPRKMDQGLEFEDKVVPCQAILFFECSEETMEARLLKRGETSGRSDDNAESIRKRFKTFVEVSMPVVDHFEKDGRVCKISAEQTPDEVYAEVKKFFASRGVEPKAE